MRAYELMIIVEGELEESAVETIVELVTKNVTDGGGTVPTVDRWGNASSPTRSTTRTRATTSSSRW